MQFYTYDNTTGVIQSVGGGQPAPVNRDDYDDQAAYKAAVAQAAADFLANQAGEGQTAVEGTANPRTQKWDVVNGGLIDAAEPTPGYAKENREIRNLLLKDSDWTQLANNPLTAAKQQEWATYRQDLRDLPETVDTFETAYLTAEDMPTQPS